MKAIALIGAAALGILALPVDAQTLRNPLVRADVSATAGWFNASRLAGGSDEWFHRSFYGGVEAGWYWTDHLKTQIDFGGTTRGHFYRSGPVFIDGVNTYENSRVSSSARALAVTGQYQFGRNAWFHPHVGAGVDLSWESTTIETQPVYYYVNDPITHAPRLLRDARIVHQQGVVVRPCAEAGFKAYISQRSFFRTDLRLRGGARVDEVLLRFGLGVDF